MLAELRDSLEFLYSDSQVSQRPHTVAALDVARGGTAAVHVLLTGLRPGDALRLAVRRNGATVRPARWFRLVDVPVERNTGLRGFVEAEGARNEFVARRAPFRVFDAMEPVRSPLNVTAPTMALRLHVPVEPDERPGLREYVITLSSGGEETTLRLAVRVGRAVVPPVGAASFPYTNWFSLDIMARRHGLRPWTEPHWAMIRRYADLMAAARQNTFWVPLSDVFRQTPRGPVLDRARLRRIVKIFTAAGMHLIEGGHFGTRTGDRWNAPTFDVVLGRVPATTAAGDAQIACIARQLMSEIDANGWRRRWVQHVADEPIAENATDYRIFTGIVRKHMPGIPILDATMNTSLVGSVDIWCPKAEEFQANADFFAARQAVGDSVWFYTCCTPGGPYLNRLLDMELIRPALFGWAAARYGLEGFLHWGLNHYRADQNPFEQSVTPHGGNAFLPAGDTHVVYPGEGGPWSSVRLEAQREGFEDLELLRKVRNARTVNGVTVLTFPRAARQLVRGVIRAFDDYTKDIAVLRRARRTLVG